MGQRLADREVRQADTLSQRHSDPARCTIVSQRSKGEFQGWLNLLKSVSRGWR
jgi:hypothetical protein